MVSKSSGPVLKGGLNQNHWAFSDRPELSSFSRKYTEYAGEVNVGCMTLKNIYFDALHLHTWSLKINIFQVLFWEGGGHKHC